MLDELTRAVADAAGLPPAQATLAVAAMLRFCTARLPSALVGELHARLGTRLHAAVGQARSDAAAVPADPPTRTTPHG